MFNVKQQTMRSQKWFKVKLGLNSALSVCSQSHYDSVLSPCRTKLVDKSEAARLVICLFNPFDDVGGGFENDILNARIVITGEYCIQVTLDFLLAFKAVKGKWFAIEPQDLSEKGNSLLELVLHNKRLGPGVVKSLHFERQVAPCDGS